MTTREGEPSAAPDPIVEIVSDMVLRLRAHSGRPGAVLTCSDLLRLVGDRAHTLALLLFSLLNLLPAPPGYNFFMALIIIVLAAAMLTGRPMQLGRRVGQMRLPIAVVAKLLDILALVTRWAASISSPRWQRVVSPAARSILAAIAVLLGVVMLVPIPFTNMLPSIGLAMMCIGALNRDGVLAIAGIGLGLLGVVITVAVAWILVVLGLALGDAVEEQLEPLSP